MTSLIKPPKVTLNLCMWPNVDGSIILKKTEIQLNDVIVGNWSPVKPNTVYRFKESFHVFSTMA